MCCFRNVQHNKFVYDCISFKLIKKTQIFKYREQLMM